MTASVSDTANSPGVASTDPGHVRVRRRSFLRVSLGGALLFAAGAMVGFAPMRAWVFLRDDPKTVLISAIVVEAEAKDVEGIREALSAHANDERTRNLDPLTILQSRPGTKTLADPTLQTMVGERATFLSGGEYVLLVRDEEVQTRRFGTELSFVPEMRRTGSVELTYRISSTSPPELVDRYSTEGQRVHLTEFDEETIESKIILRPDEWQAIEWDDGKSSDANRVRWIFLKVEPAD